MSALYPDVPIAAGVPAVLRNALNVSDAQSLLAPDDSMDASSSDDWGVFDASGSRVLDPDSVIAIESGVEFRISDYPVERGGFQSYNKVATPFEVRVTLTKGGSVADRQSFLDAVDVLQASLDLYDVSTPEKVYSNVNITRVSQARSAQSGANLAVVEILLQEVRQTVSVAYSTAANNDPLPLAAQSTQAAPAQAAPKLSASTTKSPTAVATTNLGGVQPKPVTVDGAKLVTTTGGRQLYVYNQPIGKVH